MREWAATHPPSARSATVPDSPQDILASATAHRRGYCVRTATLVLPRTVPLIVNPSWKLRKMRLTAGSKGIVPEPCTRITYESDSPPATVRVALGPQGEGFRHVAVG